MINEGETVIILKSATKWRSWNREMGKYIGSYARVVTVYNHPKDGIVKLLHQDGEHWWWPLSSIDAIPEGGI